MIRIVNKFKENIRDLLSYFTRLRPYKSFYKMQINAHNKTAHHILKNEVALILPKFPEERESKKGILVQLFQALWSRFQRNFELSTQQKT